MGYTRDGAFLQLNAVSTGESGILTVFPWPGRCASFYVGYQADSPAIHSDRMGIRGDSRLVNIWTRFKSGGGNTLIDIPVVSQSQFIVIPPEIMEVAMTNGLGGGLEPPYAPSLNTVEVRAPLGTNPFLFSWTVRYE